MPAYKAPFYQFNGHLQTIIPSLFRKVREVRYERQRISTPDKDFLDLDWYRPDGRGTNTLNPDAGQPDTRRSDAVNPEGRRTEVLHFDGGPVGFHASEGETDRETSSPEASLLIISHGLEGDSGRSYVKGMLRAFGRLGCDGLAWNFRGCSGEPNLLKRFYHSGATEDLEVVIRYVRSLGLYKNIILGGFSLGGNLTLKYLGERGAQIYPEISKAIVFSVPLDLSGSARKLAEPNNWIYNRRFVRNLERKIKDKAVLMPGALDTRALKGIKTLGQFDDAYTAPLHGFENAESYYAQCSSLAYLQDIRIPSLILNAKNDPFLSPECYPVELLKEHPYVSLETPAEGGHVGFAAKNLYYSEQRALAFVFPGLKPSSQA